MYADQLPIHFMRFAIFDAEGNSQSVFERHVRTDLSGNADASHIEEVIEDMLDAQDIDYEVMAQPIYDRRTKIWITHNLYGDDYEGCVVGFVLR